MLASASGAISVYLVAALAVQIRSTLHLGTDDFGLLIACSYAGSALSSILSGRLAEAYGGIRVMRVSAVAITVLLLLAATANTLATFAVLMVLSGVAAAAMQNATNLTLARRIPVAHQGLAFGLKQAAVPLSTVLSGLAVPLVALTIGWRWAFVFAAVFTLVTARLVPPSHRVRGQTRRPKADLAALRPLKPLLVLSAGFGLGVFSASGLTAFLVTGAVSSGISKGGAGLLFSLCGLAAASSRTFAGHLADRRGRAHLLAVASMLVVGTAGYGVLAGASAIGSPPMYVLGGLLAYAAGWGWNGLYNFTIVRIRPDAPAQATSISQTVGRVAGILGPLVFGLVVATASYMVAWVVASGSCFAASGVMLVGRRMHHNCVVGRGLTETP